jgi:putative glutamine amidotransferase
MRPLIGITGRRFRLSLLQGADPRYNDRCIDTFMSDFATRIAEAGGLPVHLSYDTDAEDVCDWLSGVVITGGQDVHPACWGGDTSVVRDIDPRTDPMVHDVARDAYEVALARAAMDRRIPVLGVCRGMQVLNVALGGTLVADLPPARRCTCPARGHPPTALMITSSPSSRARSSPACSAIPWSRTPGTTRPSTAAAQAWS